MAAETKNTGNHTLFDKSHNANSGSDLNGTYVIKNSFRKSKVEKVKEIDEKNSSPKKGNDWKDLSILQKIKQTISIITVEPILACYVMPSVLSALATQNLYLEKACRVNLNFPHDVCDALTRRDTANYTNEEEEVQKLVAAVAGWKTVLQSFLPCVILIFLGAYSDRRGQRKFCMLVPIVGEFLTSVGLMVNTYFFYQLPLEVAAVTEAIFPALTGGWVTMFMGVFSYIADVTTEEQRTLRIGVVNLFYSVGVPVGSALSGVLVREIGLYGVFSLSAALYVVSFSYGYFRIKEIKKPCSIKKTGCCSGLRDFFDTRYVKETLTVAFKKGPNNRRLRVIMLVLVLCVVIGPIYGEISVLYLFTRYRFNWDEVDYSVFSTYATCTSLVGTVFSVGVFSHLLKFDDALVGVISCASKVVASIMYAFSTKPWHIYIGPLLEIFSGTSFIAMRSMVSKLVSKDELGKVNSFFGLGEAMMPLLYAPMYTSVYGATIKSFPGAFFLLGGALTLPAVAIFLWFYLAKCKNPKEKDEDKEHTGKTEGANRSGIDNTAFEKEDELDKKSLGRDDINQSQIEMGLTKNTISTLKQE